MHDPHLSISFSQNIFMPTKDIFLCVACLLGGLRSRLADHRSQAELQLTQQTCQLGVKHRTPPLILRRGEGETQPLEWPLLLISALCFVVFGRAPKISYQNIEGSSLSEAFLTKHYYVAPLWFFMVRRQTHLQQRRRKDLSDSLVEGVDGRLQHGGHEDALMKVVFCDHCGLQFEEHQHLLCADLWCFNLT